MTSEDDLRHLRAAIAASRRARDRGNAPYGAVLVAADGALLATAENTQVTTQDCTAHAEVNLVREAVPRLERGQLAGATLYASGEPCAMCAWAIYLAGIRRVVFALGQPRMPGSIGLRAAEVLAHARPPVAVLGPVLEDEAAAVVSAA